MTTFYIHYFTRKAEERDHILQGLLIALKSIDEIVQLIKSSKDVETARTSLITNYVLTEIQANAILEMKLSRLAALEQQKILDEHGELLKLITELKEILASEKRIFNIIKEFLPLTGTKSELHQLTLYFSFSFNLSTSFSESSKYLNMLK